MVVILPVNKGYSSVGGFTFCHKSACSMKSNIQNMQREPAGAFMQTSPQSSSGFLQQNFSRANQRREGGVVDDDEDILQCLSPPVVQQWSRGSERSHSVHVNKASKLNQICLSQPLQDSFTAFLFGSVQMIVYSTRNYRLASSHSYLHSRAGALYVTAKHQRGDESDSVI